MGADEEGRGVRMRRGRLVMSGRGGKKTETKERKKRGMASQSGRKVESAPFNHRRSLFADAPHTFV